MLETVLETRNLTTQYGDLSAVDDFPLRSTEARNSAFLDPNGAGKTTAINMMCGLLESDVGQVFIHDQPIAGGNPDIRIRAGVGSQETVP